MIRSVTVVPGPPLLLPEYTGRVDTGAGLRDRAVSLLSSAVPHPGAPGRVVLVAATDRDPRSTRPPLGRRVGIHLLAIAGREPHEVVEIPWDAGVQECRAAGEPLGDDRDDVHLVVVADGSARRGEKAPGYLDERAAGLDAELVAGLRSADPERLLALDADLCAELLVHGRAPLQVAAAAMARSGPMRCADLSWEDPFGVLYVTALLEAVPPAEA